MRRYMNIWLICLPLLVCTGCRRAPSIDIIGSFLPSWMFCTVAAVIVTGVVRWQLARRRLEHVIPALALFYPSLAVALACLFWLIFFA
jgi:hypothetical protein